MLQAMASVASCNAKLVKGILTHEEHKAASNFGRRQITKLMQKQNALRQARVAATEKRAAEAHEKRVQDALWYRIKVSGTATGQHAPTP